MAIDPYGREGYTDRGDESDPRYRPRDADGDRFRAFEPRQSSGDQPYVGDGWGGGYNVNYHSSTTLSKYTYTWWWARRGTAHATSSDGESCTGHFILLTSKE